MSNFRLRISTLTIHQGSQREQHVGTLGKRPLIIGRQPYPALLQGALGKMDHLQLPSMRVSRSHGLFIPARNFWVYQDLDSANGSWLNGVRIRPGRLALVRTGDILEVADTVMKLTPAGDPSKTLPRSVLIFRGIKFKAEFRFIQNETVVQFGGDAPDFSLRGSEEYPAPAEDDFVTIVTNGEHFSIEASSTGLYFVSGREFDPLVGLRDNDEVTIGPWTLLVNDETSKRIVQDLSLGGPAAARESTLEQRTQKSSNRPGTFGKIERARTDTAHFTREEVQALVVQANAGPRRNTSQERALQRSWMLVIIATFSLVGAAALLIMALLSE